MPVELIHNQILKKLGDFLGGFEGLQDNYMESSNIRILANVEIEKLKFEPIKIITSHSIYQIQPEILMSNITSMDVISPIQNIEKKCTKDRIVSGTDKNINIKFNPKGGFVFNKQNPRAKELVNTQKMKDYEKDKEKIENTPKEPVKEQRRNDIENKESDKQNATPLVNMVSKEQSVNTGKDNSLLRFEANIDNQDETIDDTKNLEENIEALDNHLTPHVVENAKVSKKKKKNKNKKGKKKNKKGKNKKTKNPNINNSDKDMEWEERMEKQNKCILEYVGNEVTSELIELFINEIADEEELALQKTLLARKLCKLKTTEEDVQNLNHDAVMDKMDNLGIAKTIVTYSPPDYASELKKRGRKSISKLLTRAGSAVGQIKSQTFFESGKGKNLPIGL